MARERNAGAIVFYDGACALCDRFVRFVLRHDRAGRFRFAPLQGPTAARVLPTVGHRPEVLDTVVFVRGADTDNPVAYRESSAVAAVLRDLGFPWSVAGCALAALPRPLRDAAYRWVARRRYRVFGRVAHCPLPPAHLRERFLDAPLEGPAEGR